MSSKRITLIDKGTYFSKNTCEGLYSPSQRGHTFPVWIYWRRDSIVVISLLIYTTTIIVKWVALDSDISDIGDVNSKYLLQNIYYKYLDKLEETDVTKWKHSTWWWYSIKFCNSNITNMGPRVLIAIFLIMIVMVAVVVML